jgi:hypothetical protein
MVTFKNVKLREYIRDLVFMTAEYKQSQLILHIQRCAVEVKHSDMLLKD